MHLNHKTSLLIDMNLLTINVNGMADEVTMLVLRKGSCGVKWTI